MSFKVTTTNEILKIACRFNLWLKLYSSWYTPAEFMTAQKGSYYTKDKKRLVKFLNPREELDRGRWMIIKWVRERQNPEQIVAAIIKLQQFNDRLAIYYKSVGWTVDLHDKDKVIQAFYDSEVPDVIQFDPEYQRI